jgi:hypothetical protein
LISGISADTNPNLNFEIYSAQYGSQATRLERTFVFTVGHGRQRVMQYSTAQDTAICNRRDGIGGEADASDMLRIWGKQI